MALSAFEKEFKAARDRGAKDFEFNGKSYNTKLKDDSAPAKSSSKSENYSNEGRGSTEKPSTGGYSNEGRGSKPKVSTDYTPGKVPSSEQAAANRAAAVDTAKSVAGSIGDYVRNFKTPAERRSEEAKNPAPKSSSSDFNEDALSSGSAMKRGGAVKKMASGGMASSRADGIAQRGKTRGKIC
jgi:hypothetical protein